MNASIMHRFQLVHVFTRWEFIRDRKKLLKYIYAIMIFVADLCELQNLGRPLGAGTGLLPQMLKLSSQSSARIHNRDVLPGNTIAVFSDNIYIYIDAQVHRNIIQTPVDLMTPRRILLQRPVDVGIGISTERHNVAERLVRLAQQPGIRHNHLGDGITLGVAVKALVGHAMQIDKGGIVGHIPIGPILKGRVVRQRSSVGIVVAAQFQQLPLGNVVQFGQISQVGVQVVFRIAVQHHGPLIQLVGTSVGQLPVRDPAMRFDEQALPVGGIRQTRVVANLAVDKGVR
mmetsp:Transcript_15047/g.43488  ORF Transcript_15047/g.43488 Transcript_15047/m.43488 type:complete len:286 (+) Transcript_15047:4039-4896(+)